jgi:NAD(P)-dependent dehydrogenase (short-subunit alcohol dehydrogenase family)
MKIEDSVALVTGSNRGIGKAYVEALIQKGAKKVYAAMRDVEVFNRNHSRFIKEHEGVVELITLDVTKEGQVKLVADLTSDVNLLINNAGVATYQGLIGAENLEAARKEMEVNYLGTLSMIRAFAPILKNNGGGAIVNILSVASLINFPMLGSYSASKAALYSLTQGVRAELTEQRTLVFGVYPGPIDTDMAAGIPMEKAPPAAIAQGTFEALEKGTEDIFIDPFAVQFEEEYKDKPFDYAKQFAEMLPEGVS